MLCYLYCIYTYIYTIIKTNKMKKYFYTSEHDNSKQIINSRLTKKELEIIQDMIIVWQDDNPNCNNQRAIDRERIFQKLEIRLNK